MLKAYVWQGWKPHERRGKNSYGYGFGVKDAQSISSRPQILQPGLGIFNNTKYISFHFTIILSLPIPSSSLP